ncbi:MAG: FadR/GntR family transcriptional regulator [Inquilinaceae bacterium]
MTLSFKPVGAQASLTGQVVDQLAAEIRGGALRAGERLPTEAQLIAAFGVSRTVVREAFAALRAEGLVVTRQGVGAFVADAPSSGAFKIDPETLTTIDDVLHVLQLRLTLEVEGAALAAERRGDEDLAALAHHLDRFDQAVADGRLAVEPDFDFHCAIAVASRNPYHVELLQHLGRVVIPRQKINHTGTPGRPDGAYLRRLQSEHRAIQAAIAEGRADAARDGMRLHLLASQQRYRQMAESLRAD